MSLVEVYIKSNFYLVSNKLIDIYEDIFLDIDKIIHNKSKSNDLVNFKFNGLKLKYIYESDVYPSSIKCLYILIILKN